MRYSSAVKAAGSAFYNALHLGGEVHRRGYKNGAGICKHCGLFDSNAFEPSEHCCKCGKPTYWVQDKQGNWYCKDYTKMMPEEDKTKFYKAYEKIIKQME